MNVFVVSLKDSPRRTKINEILEGSSVPFEFFDAVDAQEGVPAKYESRINRKKANRKLLRRMSNTEFGCALSHALLYEKIVQENISDAIILEDDAIVTDGFFRLVKEHSLSSSNIEMAFLYHNRCYATKKKYFLNGLPYQKVAFTPYGAVGYYIKLPVAKALQKATQTVCHPSDFPIGINEQFYTVAFTPRLIKHPFRDEKQSEINTDRRWSLQYKLAYFLGLCYLCNPSHYGSFWSYVKRVYLSCFFDAISPSIHTYEKIQDKL